MFDVAIEADPGFLRMRGAARLLPVIDEGLNNGYRVERAVDVDILKWVCLEDQRDALLLRNDEDDI